MYTLFSFTVTGTSLFLFTHANLTLEVAMTLEVAIVQRCSNESCSYLCPIATPYTKSVALRL